MKTASDNKRIDHIYEKAFDERIPLSALVELTHRCNLRCRHCYVVADTSPELSTEEVKHVISQLADAGSLFLILSGGEIFLRDDVFEIAEYARSRCFALRLFTNGTLITEPIADAIANMVPLDVSISIYGSTAEKHEYITQIQGSYEDSVNALKMLYVRGITTRVKCVLMDHNANEIESIATLAEELGATVQFDPLVTPKANGDQSPSSHRISDTTLAALIVDGLPSAAVSSDRILCAAGRDMVSISPSGDVHPCVQLPLSLGSLREQSFSEIWQTSAQVYELVSLRYEDISPCASCDDIGFCKPCPGLNVIETGSMMRASRLNCWVSRVRKLANDDLEQGGLRNEKDVV